MQLATVFSLLSSAHALARKGATSEDRLLAGADLLEAVSGTLSADVQSTHALHLFLPVAANALRRGVGGFTPEELLAVADDLVALARGLNAGAEVAPVQVEEAQTQKPLSVAVPKGRSALAGTLARLRVPKERWAHFEVTVEDTEEFRKTPPSVAPVVNAGVPPVVNARARVRPTQPREQILVTPTGATPEIDEGVYSWVRVHDDRTGKFKAPSTPDELSTWFNFWLGKISALHDMGVRQRWAFGPVMAEMLGAAPGARDFVSQAQSMGCRFAVRPEHGGSLEGAAVAAYYLLGLGAAPLVLGGGWLQGQVPTWPIPAGRVGSAFDWKVVIGGSASLLHASDAHTDGVEAFGGGRYGLYMGSAASYAETEVMCQAAAGDPKARFRMVGRQVFFKGHTANLWPDEDGAPPLHAPAVHVGDGGVYKPARDLVEEVQFMQGRIQEAGTLSTLKWIDPLELVEVFPANTGSCTYEVPRAL